MIKNYLTIAWRNLLKNKVFSLINILGLTIGITVCLMIFLYIMNEFSFDNFHKQGKNIYRVMRGYDLTKGRVPILSGPYAPAFLHDFPNEIRQAVRILPTNGLVTFGTRAFNEKKLFIADDNFFTLFSFPLLKGDPATALKETGSVVLTETTAKKYFGGQDPMGRILELEKHRQLKVTGIAKDAPSNSHLDFDLVVPISYYFNQPWFNVWINNNFFTYLLLDPHASVAAVEARFPQFMNKYMGKDMERMGAHFDLKLSPMSAIYFESYSPFDNVRHGEKKMVYIFLSIAALILLIACINFTNLSTIRAVERSKEVGLRKVMGALRTHLVRQFIGESMLLTTLSCLLALGLLQLLMPLYNDLLGHTLTVSWNTPPIWLFLLGVILIVGFLAGTYPAFLLSSFSPIQALKGKLNLGKAGGLFRQTLVVVQFSISVLLVTGTLVIMSQMHYVKNKELGYDQNHTVVVPINNNNIYEHRYTFKKEMEAKNMGAVSLMSGEPGGFFDEMTFDVEGQTQVWKAKTEYADLEYVKTLGLKIIAGRDFSPQYATDTTDAVLINRRAAADLGLTPRQALGKWIKNTVRDEKRRKIVGVVEDFNFLSLKENVDPLVISPGEDLRVAVIRLNPGNIPAALETIRKAYSGVAPVYPFEYSFLDQNFDKLYKTDIRQQSMLSIFSGLAIFIACLGLFGLASFTANKRLKEIGVRKVLGSSTRNIVLLLSKDLVRPVLLATLIAIPLGYYGMNNWLQNFAYRTPLHWWIFAVAAILTLTIALLTVGVKALRAAMENPIKNLRAE